MTSVEAATGSTPTVIVHIRPIDATGHLLPGYRITRRFPKGSCQYGSEAISQGYRCFAGNAVLDPCWVTADRVHVDCLRDGWTHKVWRVHVTMGFDNSGFGYGYSRANDPWGLKRADGLRCVWVQGASGVVHGNRINYMCGHSEHHVLVGEVDRDHQAWTIRRAHDTGGGHYVITGRARIVTAYRSKSTLRGHNTGGH